MESQSVFQAETKAKMFLLNRLPVWPPDVVLHQEEEDEGEDGGGEDLLMLNQYGLI